MRVAALLLMVLLAGCTSTTSQIFVAGERGDVVVVAPAAVPGSAPPVVQSARDPEAPPVTLRGEPSHALPALVRERTGARDRVACGGALVAVAPGTGDPRGRWEAFAFVRTDTLVDGRGHGWLTDVYADAEQAERLIWVQNVGGGRGWFADDGRAHCAPLVHDERAYHVLLHVEGLPEVELFFSPGSRPAEPIASDPSPS